MVEVGLFSAMDAVEPEVTVGAWLAGPVMTKSAALSGGASASVAKRIAAPPPEPSAS